MSPLRKPPLCAKNWENWGFQYLTNISAPKYSEPTDLLGLVELHSSSKFLRNLIMIHVRDVIKWSFYWTDQKPFTGHSSNIIHFMIFSNQNFVQFLRKVCRYCFEISKKISDGQEMPECSKSLTNHTPEVKKIKWKILFSIELLHHWECWYFNFILSIISVVTW